MSRTQWTLVAAALALGGSVRVGLEDNFYLPDGTMARSNGDLVARARQMTEDAGRRVATRRRGARAAEARGMSGPLAGIRVLDLSRLLPGGFCSLLLADYGADVLKVEDTGLGDYIRWAPPQIDGVEPSAASALFLSLNRGKRSLRLDLKVKEGREVLLRLVRDHDVLLESFRPGVLDRLGVGYERLRAENPGLVYCAITGYGQDGPDRDRPGHDIDYLARNGLLGLTGERGGPPRLRRRPDRRPRRRRADGGVRDPRRPARARPLRRGPARRRLDDARRAELARDGRGAPPRRRARSRAAASSSWPAACPATAPTRAPTATSPSARSSRSSGPPSARASSAPTWSSATSTRPWPRELEAIFAARTRAEWAAFDDAHGCCLEPVRDLDEALAAAPEAIVEVDQPGATAPVRLLGPPVAMSRTPPDGTRPGPSLGADTDAVLAAAGYDDAAIAALKAAGAVAGPENVTAGSFRA